MRPFRQRKCASRACAILAIAAVAACSRKGDSAGSGSALAQSQGSDQSDIAGAASARQDPCTLLSASEAASWVGDLSIPPYRADDDHPNTTGEICVYRGRDGRELRINPSSSGGADVGSAIEDVPKKLGAALSARGAPGLDTMANRVMKQIPGPWDKATWIPGGSLFVTKGDAMVAVDVSGASGKQSDAEAIAKIAIPRLGHPLDYDGAKAVALVPKPAAHPSNVCDFIQRSEVENAIGKLAVNPVADSAGTMCTYRVETAHGTSEYPVAYEWQDGARNYNMLKHQMSMLGSIMGGPTTSVLDTMKPTGQMGEMIGGLMKMATGGKMTTAPGAAATQGFRTDTTLTGPWDHAMLYHGTQLMAVRHDAMINITLTSADYEHAKALLAAISSKL